jgi:hypothetical protein
MFRTRNNSNGFAKVRAASLRAKLYTNTIIDRLDPVGRQFVQMSNDNNSTDGADLSFLRGQSE